MPQVTQGLLKGNAGIPVLYIFIEVQVRQGRDHQNIGRKLSQQSRHTRRQFGELKTVESPGDLNLSAELLEGNPPVTGKPGEQSRVETVGPVQKQNPLALKQQSRQEVVAKFCRLPTPMHYR